MSSKKPKATRKRMISCFAQIVQEHIPGWKIEEIASGEKVKARKFSYSSQVYLLMLSQFLHLFSLNEIVDVSKIYAAELSRVRVWLKKDAMAILRSYGIAPPPDSGGIASGMPYLPTDRRVNSSSNSGADGAENHAIIIRSAW